MEMKKMRIILIAAVLLVSGGWLLYRHFVTNQIMDRGGMENPDISQPVEQGSIENPNATVVQPTADARLEVVSLGHNGMTASSNYSFYLQADGDQGLFSCSWYWESKHEWFQDGHWIQIDKQKVDARYVEELDALLRKIELLEYPEVEPDPDLIILDGESSSWSVQWSDGTAGSPDTGFSQVKDYFVRMAVELDRDKSNLKNK